MSIECELRNAFDELKQQKINQLNFFECMCVLLLLPPPLIYILSMFFFVGVAVVVVIIIILLTCVLFLPLKKKFRIYLTNIFDKNSSPWHRSLPFREPTHACRQTFIREKEEKKKNKIARDVIRKKTKPTPSIRRKTKYIFILFFQVDESAITYLGF